jgi:hypothetical protein
MSLTPDYGPNASSNSPATKQYEGLRKKGMSRQLAARIANDPAPRARAARRQVRARSATPRTKAAPKAQKAAAGRKGGKAAASKS